MNAFLIFDVSNRLDDIKTEMGGAGYYNKWAANGKIHYLPQNAMWKKDIELPAALTELRKIIENLNLRRSAEQPTIMLERCIALSTNPWDGIEGIPIN